MSADLNFAGVGDSGDCGGGSMLMVVEVESTGGGSVGELCRSWLRLLARVSLPGISMSGGIIVSYSTGSDSGLRDVGAGDGLGVGVGVRITGPSVCEVGGMGIRISNSVPFLGP